MAERLAFPSAIAVAYILMIFRGLRMDGQADKYAAAVRAARVTLCLNLGLCLTKFVIGWRGNSFALLADGVNNLTDVGVSATLVMGMRLAQRPADKHHPYGHGRIEQELTRIVSAVVLVTGGGIIWEAIKRLGHPGLLPANSVLVVACGSIGVKIYMYYYLHRVARQIGSGALAADALNHKSDVAATSCVVAGTVAVLLGGQAWASADEVATIAVGLFMIAAAGREIYHVSSELLDKVPPEEVIKGIRGLAGGYPGVAGVDLVTGRKTGMHYLIDLHLEVDPQMPIQQAHFLGHQVKDSIMAEMPEIAGIVVHMEPEFLSETG
jgi:cation diffusion facilitator family transporter